MNSKVVTSALNFPNNKACIVVPE
ncbi:MAG: hypothetical protein ACAH17_01270 [Candidatus Paceibacterota bacterium]